MKGDARSLDSSSYKGEYKNLGGVGGHCYPEGIEAVAPRAYLESCSFLMARVPSHWVFGNWGKGT